MTRDETKRIILAISTAYPNWKPENMKLTLETWSYFLLDYDYKSISAALKIYITTSGSEFAPSLSQLIRLIDTPNELAELTPGEAWEMVRSRLETSLYHSQENFDSLPEEVQRAVGSSNRMKEWASMDTETVDSVIASNFQKNYKESARKRRDLRLMPTELKQLLNGAAKRLTDNAH